ncbi:radical SAM family heme chaperone HemW [Aestuariivirga sp.]|uniref:radical SAM family heme chaperone HemW n=1 Tax=Aestuariivirga sp. TaxID=2650926 RepID=UPI0025B805ED|nr:radical SAM family heme chaperone HemW [Aestuariivirga sp.]
MTSSDAFGIYVHWPFCKAKCPYCDFNSHVRHEGVDALSFARALGKELAWFAERTPGRTVSSIFFGGGTPSLMPPLAVGHVLDSIARLWPVSPQAEITLEANPTSAEAENFRGYRAAGVNRVSVGVQALNDADLKALGRQHSSGEAIAAFRLAARVFARCSFDMIYARPNQTPEQWRAELTRALAEQQGHMSLYQLTIEPGTAYFDLFEKGRLQTPDDDRAADLHDLTQELTEKAGLASYEVSNHAVPGQESRHNLLYWRYGEYAGVGPGAHSRLAGAENRRALIAERHPETWRALVRSQGHGIVSDSVVVPADQASEYLLMGLRIAEGIDMDRYAALAGREIDPSRIAGLKSMGLVRRHGQRLMATADGRKLLNAVIAELAS